MRGTAMNLLWDSKPQKLLEGRSDVVMGVGVGEQASSSPACTVLELI